ncbi:hypothetical protein GCM10010261_62020 [Streptomyces pilosus]|nr:hypothetical protein GCM10010261_62020 [Streptomyces pilosus]
MACTGPAGVSMARLSRFMDGASWAFVAVAFGPRPPVEPRAGGEGGSAGVLSGDPCRHPEATGAGGRLGLALRQEA